MKQEEFIFGATLLARDLKLVLFQKKKTSKYNSLWKYERYGFDEVEVHFDAFENKKPKFINGWFSCGGGTAMVLLI